MGVNGDVLLADIGDAYRNLKKCSYPDSSSSRQSSITVGKDNSRATEYRNEGNVVYLCGRYQLALNLYTRSVASATENSEELALVYANRSAVLLRLGEYVPCLLDINRALKGEYPKRLQVKLQDRKKMCLIEIAKMGRVEIVGNETDPIESTATNKESNIPRGKFDNPLLPNTSSKIKLAYNEKWGRHMVAVKDIEPGEILSCEPFFVTFRLYSIAQFTNCSYCSIRCAALVSCPSCSEMLYCSKSCLTRAFNAYHRTECKMWPFIVKESSIMNRLNEALRILFVGTEQGARLQHLTTSLTVPDFFKEHVNLVDKPYAGEAYSSILQIRPTFDQPSEASVLLAVKTIIWLQRFSFFENHPDNSSMSETEVFVTLALLNHMQSVISYNFGISEWASPPSTLPGDTSIERTIVGCGTGALHNLVNHSCDPNIEFISTQAREQIFYSARPIKQGEQIFISYSPLFSRQPLVQRKFTLSCYGFNCYCKACANDWPLLTDMFNEKPKFFTNDKIVIKNTLKTIAKMIRVGVKERDIRKIIRCRKLIHEYVREPSFLSIVCEDILVRYISWTYSNLCYVESDTVLVEEEILTMLFHNMGI